MPQLSPVGSLFRSTPRLLGSFSSQSLPPNRSWYANLEQRIGLCFGGEIPQDLASMRALLPLISALLHGAVAFLRSRNQQAIVELALR